LLFSSLRELERHVSDSSKRLDYLKNNSTEEDEPTTLERLVEPLGNVALSSDGDEQSNDGEYGVHDDLSGDLFVEEASGEFGSEDAAAFIGRRTEEEKIKEIERIVSKFD
jgi:hypothetical protein